MINDDLIGTYSHDEIERLIAAVKCACPSNDRWACIEWRDPRSVALARELGMSAEECSCTCHEIWHAWLDADEDEA